MHAVTASQKPFTHRPWFVQSFAAVHARACDEPPSVLPGPVYMISVPRQPPRDVTARRRTKAAMGRRRGSGACMRLGGLSLRRFMVRIGRLIRREVIPPV